MKTTLRIILLVHESLIPPDTIEGLTDKQIAPFKTEYDVAVTLRDLGHETHLLGVYADLNVIKREVDKLKPDIIFNLLEEFNGISVFDAHVVSYLELLQLPYTGCNPRGLMLAHDKALSKMLCSCHQILVPHFHVFPIGRKAKRPSSLNFPLIVKSLTEEGSVGISQASIVHDDSALAQRVSFIHRKLGTDAIAEQYIDGRELYVGVIGNERLQTLPIWELHFPKLRPDAPRIATGKIKWDQNYQKKLGIRTNIAKNLPNGWAEKISNVCKRTYRALSLSGYARMDLRLAPDGRIYLIEANPNPQLSYGEDFAESAESMGMGYDALIHKILCLGHSYHLRRQD